MNEKPLASALSLKSGLPGVKFYAGPNCCPASTESAAAQGVDAPCCLLTFADLVADYTANGSAAHRAQYATTGNRCTGYATHTGAGYGTLLA